MKEFFQGQSWREILAGRFPDILNCTSVIINKRLVLFDLAKRLTNKLTLTQIF